MYSEIEPQAKVELSARPLPRLSGVKPMGAGGALVERNYLVKKSQPIIPNQLVGGSSPDITTRRLLK